MIKLSKGLFNWHSLAIRSFGIGKKKKDSDKFVVGMRLSLLWASSAVGFIGLVFGFDLIGEALESCLTVLFEFIQENLELMYRKGFKLDLYHAQMATAYTGFLVLTGFGFLLFRKFSVASREFHASWIRGCVKAKELGLKHWVNITVWWDALDGFNKFFAAIALVVLAIPLISVVCLSLGKVIAELV